MPREPPLNDDRSPPIHPAGIVRVAVAWWPKRGQRAVAFRNSEARLWAHSSPEVPGTLREGTDGGSELADRKRARTTVVPIYTCVPLLTHPYLSVPQFSCPLAEEQGTPAALFLEHLKAGSRWGQRVGGLICPRIDTVPDPPRLSGCPGARIEASVRITTAWTVPLQAPRARQSDAVEDGPMAGGDGGGACNRTEGDEFCRVRRGAWRGGARRAHAASLCSLECGNVLYPTSYGRNRGVALISPTGGDHLRRG
ncbi:hypothetical protein NDU88_009087 [Pleurodeles waltl]|uniref:Uncharacterized protein n=1 Tax=Pleurodeles waltl TaxID=8319 RepID=A0AAV7RZH9_PLEWA|nr:hypothetical protein NDU88_009087 [Pleurodeles waltl]